MCIKRNLNDFLQQCLEYYKKPSINFYNFLTNSELSMNEFVKANFKKKIFNSSFVK